MKKLLIVDDSELSREKIKSILQEDNYYIKTVSDGHEALKTLRKNPFDLIITDIIMPKMEGLEFIITLKKEYPALKILAVSSYKPIYLEMAKAIGANEICEKQHVPQKLLSITRDLLEN